jgi:hypothetical protein
MPMDVQCCFCGRSIDASDAEALRIAVRNLWAGEASQELYSHSSCANKRLKSVLSPMVPFDAANLTN